MDQSLDRNITSGMLLKFSLPTILSTVFMGIYSSVDSIFVARLIGTDALSAVNIVMPLLMIIIAVGVMIGAGGNALVARKIGEGKEEEARQNFTLLVLTALIFSALISTVGIIFLEPLLRLLGANNEIYPLCRQYAIPFLIAIPFALMGMAFQQFLITEGKPHLGLATSIAGGVINIFLDYLLIAVFDMGVPGAAIATGLGYSFPAIIGFIYFIFSRRGGLYFIKPGWDFSVISKASTNGVSELISMMASSVTMIMMNNILIRLSGSDGVAASSIIFTIHGILTSIYMGYSSGIAPVISFNYGKKDTDRLKKLYSISLSIILVVSIASLAASFIFARPLVRIFTSAGTEVYDMALRGFRISAVGFLFIGFNGFSSAMFTALNNGRISAVLSACRTLIFVLITLIVLPLVFGITGVWISIPAAELLAVFMTIYYFRKMKPVYHYA